MSASVTSLSPGGGRFFFRVNARPITREEAPPSRGGVVPGVDFCGAGELLPRSAGEFSPVPVLVVVVVGEGDGPRRRVETRRGAMAKATGEILEYVTHFVTGGRR
jgi:hypothetical protein